MPSVAPAQLMIFAGTSGCTSGGQSETSIRQKPVSAALGSNIWFGFNPRINGGGESLGSTFGSSGKKTSRIRVPRTPAAPTKSPEGSRSEEHTSELQSQSN